MPRPALVFDQPQCALKPDTEGRRNYANVSNALEVNLVGRATYKVAVAVPTMLFSYMRHVLRVDPGAEVTMALDQTEDGEFYIFNLIYGEDKFVDLWLYSHGSIPKFLLDPSYRL